MDPIFEKKDAFRAVCYEVTTEEYIPGSERNAARWTEIDFSGYPMYPEVLDDLGEISTWKHPAGEKEKLAYYFGCVSDTAPVPEGFAELTVPAGEYAVFTASEDVGKESPAETAAKVRACVAEAVGAWLPGSGYAYDLEHGMFFEYYRNSAAYIYLPVKKA